MSDARSKRSSHDVGVAGSAYDAEAPNYDRRVAADEWIRERLRKHYLRVFPPGSRVLDVGSGTGEDALFLARRDYDVVGCDISAEMIGRMRAKAERAALSDRIDIRRVDVSKGLPWPGASFDGIISAFGALNTVADLHAFAAEAARVLRPRGCMVLHMVNRFSIWEWLYLVRRMRLREAARLGSRDVREFLVGGRSVIHFLPSPNEAVRAFNAHFVPLRLVGQGVLAPPPGKTWLPAVAETALRRLEIQLCDRSALATRGRFFVLVLRRRIG